MSGCFRGPRRGRGGATTVDSHTREEHDGGTPVVERSPKRTASAGPPKQGGVPEGGVPTNPQLPMGTSRLSEG